MYKLLRELGLTEYETKIYLTLLEIGESSTGNILNKSGINSGKIYQILESLKDKGFVGEIKKNNIRKFYPSDPSYIREFINKKKKQIENQEKEYNLILPKILEKINSIKKDPNIEIFIGFDGMKQCFQKEIDMYKRNKELFVSGILPYYLHNKKIVDYFKYTIFPQREISGIKVKKIVSKDAKNNIKEKNAKIKYVNYSSFITFNFIGDLVIISIWLENPIFLTIISTEVAKGFKENFNLIWKTVN